MTEKALFIRVLENNGDRLYFLSCTKCGRTKEDCPRLLHIYGLFNQDKNNFIKKIMKKNLTRVNF
jgi:L-lactate utilization protein LutB